MSLLSSSLKIEYKRLSSKIPHLEKELKKLPEGCFSLKRRGNGNYLYRAMREGNKVKFKYIGEMFSYQAQGMIQAYERKKKIKKELRRYKNDVKEILRFFHGKID